MMNPRRSQKKYKIEKTFLKVIQQLNRSEIRFLIAGARALAYHGYSRFTQDYDICIAPDPHIIDRVLDHLNTLGFQLSEPVDAQMIAQSVNIHLVGEIDIDLLIHPKGFSFEKAWRNRKSVMEEKTTIFFVSKQDLIAMKIASGRPQDKLDVQKLKE